MPFIATLIADPRQKALAPALAERAADAVGARAIDWLSPQTACDLVLPERSAPEEAERALRDALADEPIDVAVHDGDGRRKRLLVADMDSTMIDQECIDELADEIGVKDRVAAITARAMNGEIAFEPALRERVALLEGLNTSVIESVIENRITLAAGARTLVGTMNASGAWTLLVSGGFDVFTSRIAAMLGFREQQANRLLEKDGRLTGRVAEPILGRLAKSEALERTAEKLGIAHTQVLAVGDGANDLDMLGMARMGVALHAKPSVAAQARFRIDHGDLTALLYLQGYRDEEFAA